MAWFALLCAGFVMRIFGELQSENTKVNKQCEQKIHS